jgi:tetratricopeptide (TPR) repeat protein
MLMRWCALLATFALAGAIAAPAAAQEKADKEAAKAAKNDEKKARALFKDAVAKFDAGEYEPAAAKFREAYALNPSWKLLYNIGQCEAALKRHGEALEAFEQYLSQGGDEVPVERREEVLAEVKRLREMSGSLEVAAPDGAIVFIDESERGRTPLPGRIRVAAGVDHAVRVELDGAILLVRNVRVGGGEELLVDARPAVVPAASESPTGGGSPALTSGTAERDRKLRIAGWAAVGVGGAALVAGAITGGLALAADKSIGNECSGNVCEAGQRDEIDKRDALALSTDVLLFAGAAIAVTGAVLLVVFRKRESTDAEEVSIAPVVTPNGAGAAAAWRF